MPDDGNEPMHEPILDHHLVGRQVGAYHDAPSVEGTRYWISAEVNVTGGTISISGTQGEISARQRVSYVMTINNTAPVSMSYHVESGNPTVTVTGILICTNAEYQANKTLLDSIGYFTGNTMPLA